MFKKITFFIIVFVYAIASAQAATRAKIAILPFFDKTGSKNYAYLSNSISSSVYKSMQKQFEFDRTDEQATTAAGKTIFKKSTSASQAQFRQLSGKTGADYLVFGTYSLKSKKIIIQALVYNLSNGQKISSVNKSTATDSRLFAAIDSVATSIVADIYKYASRKKDTGDAVRIKIKEVAPDISKLKVQSKRAGSIKAGEVIDFKENQILLQGQRTTYAYDLNAKDGKYFVHNGRRFGPYRYKRTTAYSEDGRTWAFQAIDKDRKYFVVANGKKMGPYTYVSGPTVTKKGQVAFSFKDQKKDSYLQVDKQKLGPYNSVGWLSLNEDGERWLVSVKKKKGGPSTIIDTGKEVGSYDSLANLRWGTGEQYSFTYKKKNKYYRVVGKAEVGPFDKASYSFTVSTNGKNWATTGIRSTRHYLYINGSEKASAGYISKFSVSDSGNQYIYSYREGKKWFIAGGGFSGSQSLAQPQGPFDSVSSLVISDNTWAAVVRKNPQAAAGTKPPRNAKKVYMVMPGETHGPYRYISYLKMVDGKVFALGYGTGKEKEVFIEGKKQAGYNQVGYYGVSEAGQWWFSFNKNNQWFVKTASGERGPFKSVGARFSGDRLCLMDYTAKGVMVDCEGEKFGPVEALYEADYDQKNRLWSFLYRNDKDWFVRIGNRQFGPGAFSVRHETVGSSEVYTWFTLKGRRIQTNRLTVK